MFPKVILKSGKEKSIQRRHPWIFSGAVYGVSREIHDGEMVDVVDSQNNHLGTGYFSDKGSIVVRILTFADEIFSENFLTFGNLKLGIFQQMCRVPPSPHTCFGER